MAEALQEVKGEAARPWGLAKTAQFISATVPWSKRITLPSLRAKGWRKRFLPFSGQNWKHYVSTYQCASLPPKQLSGFVWHMSLGSHPPGPNPVAGTWQALAIGQGNEWWMTVISDSTTLQQWYQSSRHTGSGCPLVETEVGASSLGNRIIRLQVAD